MVWLVVGLGWRVQVVVGCGELIPHFDGLSLWGWIGPLVLD